VTADATPVLSIYYDFASPFCYVARAIADRLAAVREITMEWLPFEVIDYLPAKGAMPQNPAFVRRNEATRALRLAEQYGLILHLRERLLNSNLALCAVEYARCLLNDAGAADRLHGALFDAFYRDERDISEIDIVLQVGKEAGMRDGLEDALRSGSHTAAVAASRTAAHALGVVAVPTWLCNGSGIVGIVEFEEYQRLFDVPANQPPTPRG
jgi:predicted DsbA family dithiol-disulfide isomerase